MNVFPLQTILFQYLFLLVAIAIEASILRHFLRLTRKNSIEYAATINLFTTILGWIAFFFLLGWLPDLIRIQIISYIFFDRLVSLPGTPFGVIIMAGLIAFFASFVIKLAGLKFLGLLLEKPKELETTASDKSLRPRTGLAARFNKQPFPSTKPSPIVAVLLGNACSNSAILLILLLRALQLNSISI